VVGDVRGVGRAGGGNGNAAVHAVPRFDEVNACDRAEDATEEGDDRGNSGDWVRGPRAVTTVAGGGRAPAPPSPSCPEEVACPSPSCPKGAARRVGDLLTATIQSSLAASAKEELAEDLLELPDLRRWTSTNPAHRRRSSRVIVLRPLQVARSLPRPLAAAHSAAGPCGRSSCTYRSCSVVPDRLATGRTNGSGMR
jgi:hypothetical protein